MVTGLKKFSVSMLVALIIMAVGPLSVAYSQMADDDVFGVIRVTNPEDVVAQVGMLVDKVEPGMGAMVNGMAMGQLQMLLKNPQWIGMDKTGEFTVIVLDPNKYPAPFALLVPLTNEGEYVEVLKQAVPGFEEVDGVIKFGEEGMPQAYFVSAGALGVLADNAEVATQVKALVDGGSQALKSAPIVKGQVTASIALTKVMVSVRPMIEGFAQMAVMGMTQEMAEDEAAAGAAEPMAGMLQSEINTILGLLEQTDKLELGLTVNPDEGARLMEVIVPVPDTALAKFFAAQSPEKSDMLGFLPVDSALVSSGSINFTPEFIDGYAEFSKAIGSAASPEDVESAEKMAQFTKDAMMAFAGGFAAAAFSPSQESLVTEVLSLSDPGKMKSLIQQYPEMFQSFLGMYESMGLDLDLQVTEPEQYKGGEILTIDLGFAAEEISDPEGQEAFKSIFGDQLVVPMGFVGNYAVVGMGKDARGQVEKLVDAVEAGERGAVAMSPANFGLPEENNFFLGLSVPKILKWVATYAPDAPEFDIMDGPGIGIGARFTETHAEGELVVPLAEILAIKDVAPHLAGRVEEAPVEEAPVEEPVTQ
jgi:hypothetical protein